MPSAMAQARCIADVLLPHREGKHVSVTHWERWITGVVVCGSVSVF
ncbi:MAG: hypothetical protein MJA29_13595 [Candidatus Omnitrophica bacterium]|nr:hypothetical protein [Candidatus Omnitrophota bacterium]